KDRVDVSEQPLVVSSAANDWFSCSAGLPARPSSSPGMLNGKIGKKKCQSQFRKDGGNRWDSSARRRYRRKEWHNRAKRASPWLSARGWDGGRKAQCERRTFDLSAVLGTAR